MIVPAARRKLNAIELEDEVILHDVAGEQLHRLNHTAFLIWQSCDGVSSLAEITADLAHAFDTGGEAFAEQVAHMTAQLASGGLLKPEPEPPMTPVLTKDTDEIPAPPSESVTVLGPYAGLDYQFEVAVHDGTSIELLERTLEPLLAPTTESLTRYDVWSAQDRNVIYVVGGDLERAADDLDRAMGILIWHINQRTVAESGRYLILHAGCVANDDVAVLFPARSNSGKSTLTAVMVEAGWRYLTDEAAAIDLATGHIAPYPKAITLDPGSQDLLGHLRQKATDPASAKWQIPIAPVHDEQVGSAKVTHLVFPTYHAGARNTLISMTTTDALMAMAENAFNFHAHSSSLAEIAEFVKQCACFSLEQDGIEGPLAAIESLRSSS